MVEAGLPPGTTVVSMGTIVSVNPLDLFKTSEGKVDLITILTKDPVVTRTCYHDKVGFRFHEIAEATQVGLQPSIHYTFLIAVWNTDKAGKQIIDNAYTIMCLSVPDKVYKRLVRKYELNGDLRKLVLQVELEGEAKYQGMNFEVTQIKPPYMVEKALFDTVQEDVRNFQTFLPTVRAGVITGEAFMELWKKEGVAVESGKNDEKFSKQGHAKLDTNQNTAKQIGTLKNEDFNFSQGPTGGGAGAIQQGATDAEVVKEPIVNNAFETKADDFNFDDAQK